MPGGFAAVLPYYFGVLFMTNAKEVIREAVMPRIVSCRRFALIAAAGALTLAAVPAAQAFTVEDAPGNTVNQNFLDLSMPQTSDQGSGFTQRDGKTTFSQGNTSLQFGRTQSFDRQYSPENLFDPMGHPPGVR